MRGPSPTVKEANQATFDRVACIRRLEMRQHAAGAKGNLYGWVVVIITAVLMGAGIGSLSSLSIFLKPISEDLSWARGATAFAYLAGTASLGLFSLLMGWLADRYTVRLVALMGTVAMGLSYLLLSRLDAPWQLYLLYCLLGGLGSAALFSPLLSQVGQWFQGRSGMAIGICTALFSLAQSVMPSLSRLLITELEWRGAYAALGWGCLLALAPLALLLRSAPAAGEEVAASGPAGEAAPALQHPATVAGRGPNGVVWVSLAAVFCCIAHATLLIHLVPLSQDIGVAPQSAAGLMTTIFIAGLFGRLVGGYLSDRIGGLRQYILFSLGQTIPLYGFLFLETLPALYLLTAVFGFFFGGVMTGIFTALETYVSPENRGVSFGLVSLFGWVGMGVGGYQGGFFFDLSGSYHLPFQIAMLAGVVNMVILILLMYRTRPPALAPATA